MIARVKTDRKSVTSDEIGSLHSLPLSQGWTEAKTSALDWVALFRLPPITTRDALRIRLWRLPACPFHNKPPTNSTWLAWFRGSLSTFIFDIQLQSTYACLCVLHLFCFSVYAT
ncbi:Uncharacterized protein HZ326_5299 [Fusarium oxysporum f. sp. albedinis]|nr:Uncharacterized protein HZ326_5299 [Fusarium oxysporum f. sp. albedinis]